MCGKYILVCRYSLHYYVRCVYVNLFDIKYMLRTLLMDMFVCVPMVMMEMFVRVTMTIVFRTPVKMVENAK